MIDPKWVTRQLAEYIHECVIEIGGGSYGLRDGALLESELARLQNLQAYGETDIFQLAASYAEGIARNHTFVDGNKRTAFFVASDFLEQNGSSCELTVKCSSGYVVLFQSVLNFHQLALEDFCGRSKVQAFAWRCVEAVANRLQISICQRRRFGRAGQVLSQSVVRVFHGAFLIRRLRVTKPSQHRSRP